MAFWPFGPAHRKSNINKVLDDYFRILTQLDRSVVRASGDADSLSLLSIPDEDSLVVHEFMGRDGIGAKNSDDYNYDLSKIESLRIDDIMNSASKPPLGPGNPSRKLLTPSVSNSRSSLSSMLYSSHCDRPHADVSSVASTSMINQNKRQLDSSFVGKILRENDLLDELLLPNSSLLDFICFGYFYEFDNVPVRISHIDYLIDRLLACLDEINEEEEEEEEGRVAKRNMENYNEISDDFISSFSTLPKDGNDYRNLYVENNNIGSNNDGNMIDSNGSESESENDDTNSTTTTTEENNWTAIHEATIIADILSQESIWLINEFLLKSSERMNKLWSIINHPNLKSERSLQLTFFLRIHENLLLLRQEQYLNFIRASPNFIDDILRHTHIPSLLDFLLKIISTDKMDSPTGMIDLAYDQDLIVKCLDYFNSKKYSSFIQNYVTDFLQTLIEISMNFQFSNDDIIIGPNKLTRQLTSRDIVRRLINIIVDQGGHALCDIVIIIIELIRKNNSDYDQTDLLKLTIRNSPPSDRDPLYLGYLLEEFTDALPDLYDIVIEEELKEKALDPDNRCINQLGEVCKPLGFIRVKIVELIAELLHCSNMATLNTHLAKSIALDREEYRNNLDNLLKMAQDENTLHFDDGDDNDNDDESANANDLSIDESIDKNNTKFEPPYISTIQNDKLRKDTTVGDAFKIKLFDLEILPKLLQTFISHPWNNFWHSVIFDIIQQLFNGRMDYSYNSFLVFSLFDLKKAREFSRRGKSDNSHKTNATFGITQDFVIECYKMTYKFHEIHGINYGFMGHLVMITEEIVKFSSFYNVELISPDILPILANSRWQYISKVILNDTRLMYGQVLGGGSYVDDGNGNLIPQIPIGNDEDTHSSEEYGDADSDEYGTAILSTNSTREENKREANDTPKDVDSKDFIRNFTDDDLHKKIGILWEQDW